MNDPDVTRPQGRRGRRHATSETEPAGAALPAVLEQSPGEQISLEHAVGRGGPMAPRQAAAVGLAVLDQIVAMHARGTLHGDVRPGSVLLGPNDRVTLLGPTFRSPTFTAPEGVTGPAADLWSLGATVYTAVEGRPPAPGGSLDNAGPLGPILTHLLSGDPGRRPDPGTLRNVLLEISLTGTAPAVPFQPPAPDQAPPTAPGTARRDARTSPAGPPLALPAGSGTAAPDREHAGPGHAGPGPGHAVPEPGPPDDDPAANPEATAPRPAVVVGPGPAASSLQAGPGAPARHEAAPGSGPVSRSRRQEGPTGPTEHARGRSGLLVPMPIVALTGALVVGMAAVIGYLLASAPGDPAAAEPVASASAGPGGRFAAAPRTCSMLDEKQAGELVPGFRSSEVEPGVCDWLNQQDWRKPSTQKYDLHVRLVAMKQSDSGVQRAKEYIAGKKKDFVTDAQFATPKPAPPGDLKGIGEEAFTTGKYSKINLYGGSYKVSVVFRVSNLIGEVEYEQGGVDEDAEGRLAAGAQKAARWIVESLKANG
ncbi:hypothetical protein AB0D67_29425 [Streptosporangium sp. NPDC048047]|uniref:hypothetical protein n=1 Tax=Streptosporangium sp. NPDC048047 TaxID=3155748 RepID=UPI0034418434